MRLASKSGQPSYLMMHILCRHRYRHTHYTKRKRKPFDKDQPTHIGTGGPQNKANHSHSTPSSLPGTNPPAARNQVVFTQTDRSIITLSKGTSIATNRKIYCKNIFDNIKNDFARKHHFRLFRRFYREKLNDVYKDYSDKTIRSFSSTGHLKAALYDNRVRYILLVAIY